MNPGREIAYRLTNDERARLWRVERAKEDVGLLWSVPVIAVVVLALLLANAGQLASNWMWLAVPAAALGPLLLLGMRRLTRRIRCFERFNLLLGSRGNVPFGLRMRTDADGVRLTRGALRPATWRWAYFQSFDIDVDGLTLYAKQPWWRWSHLSTAYFPVRAFRDRGDYEEFVAWALGRTGLAAGSSAQASGGQQSS